MQTDYRKYYNTLNLEPGADWPSAQLAYRRLVNEWHPDRHTEKPADYLRAQSYFIELTSSFDAIRKFHRQYKRMPLAYTKNAGSRPADQGFKQSDSLLNRARKQQFTQRKAKHRHYKRTAIYMLGAGFCVSVLLFLFTLDKQLALRASEEARRTLKNTAPSEFQRSPIEISRGEATGAFIEYDPANGALNGESEGELFSR